MTSKNKKKKKKKYISPFFKNKSKPDFTTVKTSLKTILKDYDVNYPLINDLVIQMNEIAVRTYQFIRLFVLYKYHKNEEIPKFNSGFIMDCIRMCGVSGKPRGKRRNSKPKDYLNDLKLFYENQFKSLIDKGKELSLKGITCPLMYLAIDIETSIYNNIKVHFLTRIRRFLNIVNPCPDTDKKVFNKIKNAILLDKIDRITDDSYKKWAFKIKKEFLPPNYKECYGYDVKCDPHKYIFYSIKMNEHIEKLNEEINSNKNLTDQEKSKLTNKLFQVIPLRNSIVPKYITFDAKGLLRTIAKCHFKGKMAQVDNKIKDNASEVWSSIFNTENRVMKKKGYEFKTLQTDGVGVSICFQKVGRKYKQEANDIDEDKEMYISDLNSSDLKTCETKTLVSVDPGKLSLVYMLDQKKNKLRYSAPQRRFESKAKRCQEIIENEKTRQKINEIENTLSLYNSKTVKLNRFKEYIKKKTIVNGLLKKFYYLKLWRKFKWRKWIATRKSEDLFLNRIESTFGKKEDLLICYGNWSRRKQMKYMMPTKGIGLRRIISKRFNVVLVDEYKTSALCSRCNSKLTNYKNIHRVLVCTKCEGISSESRKNIFMHRDINACMNMLRLSNKWIKTQSRLKAFCRSESETDLLLEQISVSKTARSLPSSGG